MKKADRQKIFDKYGGRCAYTGKELDAQWQVDHMMPRLHCLIYNCLDKHNHIDNLVPTLKIINHYKRQLSLEGWRKYMLNFHKRFDKYPKNPYTETSIKRKAYMQQVADAFGITIDKPFNGIFYFETLSNT